MITLGEIFRRYGPASRAQFGEHMLPSQLAALLEVDRLEQVTRPTPEGAALDTLLWGRKPA